MQEKISYRKVRDLGGIFSAAFGFVKQNFKPFFGSILFLAGPFIIVGSAVSAYMIGSSTTIAKMVRNMDEFYGKIIVSYLSSIIFYFIGVTVYNVVLNKNILANEKLENHESLTLNHSLTGFFSDFWRMLGNMLLLTLFMVIAIVVIALVIGGLFALVGGGGGPALVLPVLMVIIVFFGLLLFGPVLSYIPVAAMFVCQRDRISIFAALRKVFYYLKDNFWMTWVVSMVAFVCYIVMSFFIQIPVFIINTMSTFSRFKSTAGYDEDDSKSLLLVIVVIICSLLSYCVMSIYYLMTVYQYTNLEEKKEGSSIIEKINQIQ
ncbi:MAG: hypothetical protein H0W73_03930 [Bacteroidetes bacterium]|nr:hypothetical protein [Bacteroidota bacterium]